MTTSSVKLAFTGDICLTFLADTNQAKQTFQSDEWPAIRQAIGSHDFLVGNFECCLVDNENLDEVRRQRMAVPPSAAEFLHAAGFTDLNLANNHMLDCGPKAIEYTRKRLSAHGIRHFGAGSNRHEAEKAVFAEQNSHRVAFLSACDDSAYYAGKRRPGIAPMLKSRLRRRVRTAALQADLVVVTIHADLEFASVPGVWRQRLSRWLIRQGAHLVIQHHPHVLQGVEAYRGGLIAYSLGNFIFRLQGNSYQEHKPRVYDSLVFVVDADLSGPRPQLRHRIVPVRIDNNHLPSRLTSQEDAHARHHFESLSALLAAPKKHRYAWFRRCRTEAYARAYSIYCAISHGDFRKAGRESWWLLTRPEDRRWIVGLISLGFL